MAASNNLLRANVTGLGIVENFGCTLEYEAKEIYFVTNGASTDSSIDFNNTVGSQFVVPDIRNS